MCLNTSDVVFMAIELVCFVCLFLFFYFIRTEIVYLNDSLCNREHMS